MNCLLSHSISCVYRNGPLNFHCTALSRHYAKSSVFHRANNKNKGYISGWTMGAYAEVFLYRKSWHGALPSCAATERVLQADSAGDRKHVWMCGCSRNVFALSGPCVYVTWNVVANRVCLCSARVAVSNEQTHTHTHSVWKPLSYALFLTCSIMNYKFPNNRLCLVPVVPLIVKKNKKIKKDGSFAQRWQFLFSICGSVTQTAFKYAI